MPVGELEAKAGKNRIDMAEHLMNVEAGFDVFVAHEFSNIFVFFEVFQEIFPFEPALHGVALYPAVSLFADCALFNEGVEKNRAVDEAARQVRSCIIFSGYTMRRSTTRVKVWSM